MSAAYLGLGAAPAAGTSDWLEAGHGYPCPTASTGDSRHEATTTSEGPTTPSDPFPAFDGDGGRMIGNPKGGVTWISGRQGTPSPSRSFPWDGRLRSHTTQPPSRRLVPRRKDTTSAPQGYYEYTPPGYPGRVEWPLLVALHGVGENGNGNDHLRKLADNGIPRVIAEDRWHPDRPFIVLAPQHPSWGCPKPKAVHDFIAWALNHYPVDERYVYLAGSSCGANSIWSYLRDYLDQQVAGVVVVSGDGRKAWQNRRCQLGSVAIWAFHGHRDPVIEPAGTHVPLDGLARCESPIKGYRKTIYPDRGHGAWYRTWGDMSGHDVYRWLLGYARNPG